MKMIDLHRHLDGSVTPEMAKRLAALQGIALPGEAELEKMLRVPVDCKSLTEFLQCFAYPCSLMQTYEGLRLAAMLAAEDMGKENILYGELRFAPQLHTLRGMTQEEAVCAALEGLRSSSVKCNLILCFMRGEGNEAQNLETLVVAEKYLVEDGGVVAVDLAGAEALFPTEKYRALFAMAKERNIPFTVHAGEADGPESVRLAIEYGAKRIGHGVRIREDEEVLRLVKEKGIVLEMCPTSNRQTVAVEDMSTYPLTAYLKQGIAVTLNTDDPAIEGTDIGKEYAYAENDLGLSEKQKKMLLDNAIRGAFTDEKTREWLRKEI